MPGLSHAQQRKQQRKLEASQKKAEAAYEKRAMQAARLPARW